MRKGHSTQVPPLLYGKVVQKGNRDEAMSSLRRPVQGQGRKGFLIWNCWECSAKRATVTAVLDKNDRDYGFATRDGDGATVYFHFSRLRVVQCNGGDYLLLLDPEEELPVPEIGDRIIYHEMPGEKTMKALWWAFEKKYNTELLELEDRPIIRFVYRDGKMPISRLHEKPKFRTVWEGKNLEELRLRFDANIYPVTEKGHMAKYFEVYNPDSEEWDNIEDPR